MALFGAGGLPVVAIAKIALTAVVSGVDASLARSPTSRLATAVPVVVLGAGIVAGLVGGATNTAAIGLL